MGSRNADTVLEPDQLRQHLRSVNDWYLSLPRLYYLRIALADSSRGYHNIVILDIRGIVPDGYSRTKIPQPPGLLRFMQIRSGDLIPEIYQNLGYAAHPDSTDSDEVHSF